jgi:polar amino acid transport system substrate-binding protein
MFIALRSRISLLLLLALLPACGLPRDPEKTSNRIASTHELRVGISDSPPWTLARGEPPGGVEPDLVRGFARQMGAQVLWRRGSESSLVHSLEEHELDLVTGGFDKKTQWSSKAGVSQPFAKDADGKQHVILVAPGENGLVLALDRFLTGQRDHQS